MSSLAAKVRYEQLGRTGTENGGKRWEILVADGTSSPPVMVTNDDETDYLYGETDA